MALTQHGGRTPEELVSCSIAPVKVEFWQEVKPAEPSTTGTGSSDGQGTQLSRRQRKKQGKQLQARSLCNNFVAGKCKYGDSCKFTHDLTTFLEQAPPALPGQCPFRSLKTCPYGLACRWAASHASADHKPAEAASLTGSARTPQSADPNISGQPATESEHLPTTFGRIMSLPTEELIHNSTNLLSKDVQMRLRKGQYDFATAQQALRGLNILTARKGAKQKQQKQAEANGDLPVADLQIELDSSQQDTSSLQNGHSQAGHAAVNSPPNGNAAHLLHMQPATNESAPPEGTMQPSAVNAAHQSTAAAAHPAAGGSAEHKTAAVLHDSAEPAGKRQRCDESALLHDYAQSVSQQFRGPENGEEVKLFDSRMASGEIIARLHPRERPVLDLKGKLYLAPLTTVGNLPFRRVCKGLGADVTCGEMALATNLLQGQASEWALLKRHPCEDLFGVQICGGYTDSMTKCAQLLEDTIDVSFVDVNCGCPIDLVCNKGAGSALLHKQDRLEGVMRGVASQLSCAVTLKLRTGYTSGHDIAHSLLPRVASWGVSAATLHGRSRTQRYSGLANWDYISQCASAAPDLQLIGNGDIFAYTDYQARMEASPQLATTMLARGALIKPWLFTEIKESRHWDITAQERLELLQNFCSFGLQHWGSDARGVETTRRFLLEWLSYLHRYIPVALLDVVPQHMQWRAPSYVARNELETLMSGDSPRDWIRISEMLLGPAPAHFSFTPKHKSNAYGSSEASLAHAPATAGADGEDNG